MSCTGNVVRRGNKANLAGQKEAYLAAQIKAFRDGTRQNPMMSPMAQGLSDADIANLAAYLSAQ